MSIQSCSPRLAVINDDFAPAATLLKAVADPYRLTILAMLASADGEICVCDFTDALPLNQPTVSHHLRILREAGLTTCERRGTWVYYRVVEGARDRLIAALTAPFPQKVEA